ncbi:hypothetical protein [Bradyrhizobium genosp. P]|uniref:hypothetical protein n=1 Tax=Bradyrhizobium genosp. P TaxID=83641 RepID=UPI003CE78F7B
MDEEKLLAAIAAIAEGLRADISNLAGRVDDVSASYDQLAGQIKAADAAGSRTHMDRSMRRDNDDRDPIGEFKHAARQTAADSRSDSVPRSEFVALAHEVSAMKKTQVRPMADLDAYADAQAKADAVMRALGSRAEPPMYAEQLIPYKIRLARKMQAHSPRWKGVDLQLIAADQIALEQVVSDIRSDAMASSMNTDGMPEFQHRMITKSLPGGHTVNEWIGRGTFVKQLSRPVRHVSYIGVRQQ